MEPEDSYDLWTLTYRLKLEMERLDKSMNVLLSAEARGASEAQINRLLRSLESLEQRTLDLKKEIGARKATVK